jgi:hypothetical protein
MELRGHVENGVIVLDTAAKLPDGTKVRIAPVKKKKQKKKRKAKSSLGEIFLRHAGTIEGLPNDFAENHDHYIHGCPKK